MNIILKNQETFQTNTSIHNINTRNSHHQKYGNNSVINFASIVCNYCM